MTYSQVDRIVEGGILPLADPVGLPDGIGKTYGLDFFPQRRELGLINVGGSAVVSIDGQKSRLARSRRSTSAWARKRWRSAALNLAILPSCTTTRARPTARCRPTG